MSFIFTPPYYSTESPLVSSDVFYNFSPYLSSSPNMWEPSPVTINLDYSRPLISTYETIDTNPDVRKKMVDYFYDLIMDKWLLDDLNDILNYFKVKDGKVVMIENLSEYNKGSIKNDSNKVAEDKAEFVMKNVIDKDEVERILNKFTKKTNTKYVNLLKNEYFLKSFVKEWIERVITKKLKK